MDQNASAILWRTAVDKCRRIVGEKEYKHLLNVDNERSLVNFYENRGKDGMVRIDAARPVIQQLKALHEVISLFCPSSDAISGLVWGSFTCILESAARFLSVHDDILGMWKEITTCMLRFDIYARVFRDVPMVEDAIVAVFVEYIRFCSQTLKFLKRRPFQSIVRMGWSGEKARFAALMHNIHQNVDNADKAANAAGISMQHERHAQIVALMRPQLPRPFQLNVNCKVLKYPRSPIFHGRPDLLQIMHDHLKPYPASSNLRTFAIYGMGGVGKTQLALEYCYQHESAYPAIFWVSAARQEKLFRDFQTISQYLGLESHQVSDQWRIRDMVLVWMKQNAGSWLLVFDNVDDAALLQEFLPAADSGGAVLMTSRNSSLVPGIAESGLEVEPFSEEESAKLLLCILGKPAVGKDFDIATKIGQELAGLPLAISQMAGFIQQTRCPLEEFLPLYRSNDNYQKIQSQSTLIDRLHYHLTLQNVWEMSFSRLDDSSKAVLDVFALLDPDGIPEKLLRDSIGMSKLKFLDSNLEYYSAIRHLRQHCLIKQYESQSEHFFSIHRLIQMNTRCRPQGYDVVQAYVRGISLLRNSYPTYSSIGLPLSEVWDDCKLLTSHVIALSNSFSKDSPTLPDSDLELYAELLHVTSQYLWEQGSWTDAWHLLRLAERSCNLPTSTNLVLRAHIACGLGVFCLEDSMIDDAAHYNEMYVDLRKRYNESLGDKLGTDEILMLSNAYNNLGNAYCAQNNLEKALETHRLALRLRRSQNSPLHIALSRANLSRVLQFMGRLSESKAHMQEALLIQKAETGSDNTRYALFLHNMGSVLGDMNDWHVAKKFHSEALTIRSEKLGEANDTAISQHMLARCCFELQEYETACKLLEDAIKIFEKGVHSTDRVARSTFKLAQVKEKMGRLDEASSLRQKAEDLRRSLSKDGSGVANCEESYDKLTVYMNR